MLHAQYILHVCQYMALLTISHLWKKLCYDFAYRIHIIYYLDKNIWLCHFYIPAPKSWEWGILVLFYTCRKFLCFTVRRCLTCYPTLFLARHTVALFLYKSVVDFLFIRASVCNKNWFSHEKRIFTSERGGITKKHWSQTSCFLCRPIHN